MVVTKALGAGEVSNARVVLFKGFHAHNSIVPPLSSKPTHSLAAIPLPVPMVEPLAIVNVVAAVTVREIKEPTRTFISLNVKRTESVAVGVALPAVLRERIKSFPDTAACKAPFAILALLALSAYCLVAASNAEVGSAANSISAPVNTGVVNIGAVNVLLVRV